MNQNEISKAMKKLAVPNSYRLAIGTVIVSIFLGIIIVPRYFQEPQESQEPAEDTTLSGSNEYLTRAEFEKWRSGIQLNGSEPGPQKSLEVIYAPQVVLGTGDSFRILAYVVGEDSSLLDEDIEINSVDMSLTQVSTPIKLPNDDNTTAFVVILNDSLESEVDYIATVRAADLSKVVRIRLVPARGSDITDSSFDIVDNSDDKDRDGLTDSEEENLGTDPENPDSDGDGVSDYYETQLGTDPNIENLSNLTVVPSFYSIEEKLIGNISNELPFFIFPPEKIKIISVERALILLPYDIGEAVIQDYDLEPEFGSVVPVGVIKAIKPEDLPKLETGSFVFTSSESDAAGNPLPMPLLPIVCFEDTNEVWIIGYVGLNTINE